MHSVQAAFSGFLRNTLVNAAGIAGGQLIVLLAMPVLARKYSPAEFGVYASLVAVSSVTATAACMRFDVALPATTDGETPALYRLGVLACLISLCIGVLAVWLGLYRLSFWPQVLSNASLALLAVVVGTLQGLLFVFTGTLVRQGSFLHTAMLRIIQPASFIAVALMAVPLGLPVAFAIGVVTAVALGLLFSRRYLLAPARYGLRQAVQRYWEYPVISLPTAVLDTVALSLPLLFIVQHYGAAAGGNYSQVQRLAAAPLLLCAVAISQVFYKHAGDVVRSGHSARPLLWKTVKALSTVGAGLIAIAILMGEPLLTAFLGTAWRTDTIYLLLILLPAVIRTCVAPITTVFLITKQVRLCAAWQVTYAAVTFAVLSYASTHLPLEGLLICAMAGDFAMYAIYLWLADLAIRRFDAKEF
ncbi:MAG: polysaccharide biosynthesis protein [Noviherbaspirillum sp.]|nr:polysaccharide biosynthesis protein [Noviherbaspirillum sp.]